MLSTVLILSALVISGVEPSCQCYQKSPYTGLNAPISNGYDDSNFTPCYPGNPCPYTAYTGSDSLGWKSLTITWGNTIKDKNAVLQIWDGQSASGLPFATITAGEQHTSTSPLTLLTTSPYITIKYTQQITNDSNTFYGSVTGGSPLASSTIPQTTTSVPTTQVYNSTDFSKNPQLISHDILIVFNQKSSLYGPAGLSSIKDLATNFINQLSISSDVNSTSNSQSRLAVASFTPYDPYYSVQGQIWGINSTDAIAVIPSGGIAIDGDFNAALTKLVDVAFDVTSKTAPTRPNVQRTVLVFAADWSQDGNLGSSVQTAFAKRGVNLGVIGYNLNETVLPFLQNANHWFNYINLLGSNTTDVGKFVNLFFFNQPSNGLKNNWCPQSQTTQTVGESELTITEPSDYNGAGPSGVLTWKDYNGQSARYCNFQNNQYTVNNPENKSLKVEVFYELEVERDYLKFYENGVELESFTGYDVNSASFVTKATVLSATFTTDNKGVYRGFYVSITIQT